MHSRTKAFFMVLSRLLTFLKGNTQIIHTRVSHNKVTAVSRRGTALPSGGLPGWHVGLGQKTDVHTVSTRGQAPVSI